MSCLKVFYKRSFLKQYNKAGRVLRTEVCVNDPRDFRIGRSLVHLGYLGTVAYHALTREQQFLRIHEAGLDKRVSLLGAATWVRAIHQAALIIQEGMQVPPGP